MKDRVSLYPGRVKLTPVAGQTNTFDMVRADEPQIEGTSLNKANLLADDTATSMGLDPETATPNDALVKLLADITTVEGESAKVVYGTYTGNGSPTRTITFTGTPIFLYVVKQNVPRDNLLGMRDNQTIGNVLANWTTAKVTWNTNSITLTANYYNESQSESIHSFNAINYIYTYMIICK